MNLYITVVRIVSRVKELGIGIQFDYGEVNQWLGISSGDDLMWSCDKLSDRLIVKHRISLELDRIDGFLIDANVFPGSSGSIVVLKQQSTTIGPRGETVVSGAKKTPYILGIVSGSIPISDTALGTVQRMGLGVVYSAEAIRTVVELFPK